VSGLIGLNGVYSGGVLRRYGLVVVGNVKIESGVVSNKARARLFALALNGA
jgi:hypothetical protein